MKNTKGNKINQAYFEVKAAVIVISPSPTASLTPTLIPSLTEAVKVFPTTMPKIDCIGVDGKHMQVTQKECDDFNNAWKVTPTPQLPRVKVHKSQ